MERENFFLGGGLTRLHGVTTLKTTVHITSTVNLKPNDSPLPMITGYLVCVIKSWAGYKDVSLKLTAPGCLNRQTL